MGLDYEEVGKETLVFTFAGINTRNKKEWRRRVGSRQSCAQGSHSQQNGLTPPAKPGGKTSAPSGRAELLFTLATTPISLENVVDGIHPTELRCAGSTERWRRLGN